MDFWRFARVTDLGFPLEGSYNWVLVLLSVGVASLAAFVALAVVRRVQAIRDPVRLRVWQAIGALTMGTGIWAMHFTAMLAFAMPVNMGYVWWITLVSAIPAIVGSGAAFHIMARNAAEFRFLLLGGLALAVGIGTMHYVGMEAMQGELVLRYDLYLFVMSIVVALALATIALFVRFALIRDAEPTLAIQVLGAGLMGLAISGMHYTAMGASIFYRAPGETATSYMNPTTMAIVIVFLVSAFLGLALLGITRFGRGDGEAAPRREAVQPEPQRALG